MSAWLEEVKWQRDGLVPAIAQDAGRRKVLTLAWMNREALGSHGAHAAKRTTGRARATSCGARASSRAMSSACGDPARLRQRRDLVIVEQVGGIACHTGREHCFFQRLEDGLGGGRAGAEGSAGIYGPG